MALSNTGIVVVLIVALLVVVGVGFVFLFNPFSVSNPPAIVNPPVDEPIVPVVSAPLCDEFDNSTTKLIAIASDTNVPKTISYKGGAAPFFLLYQETKYQGKVVGTTDPSKPLTLNAVAILLKNRKVEAVVLSNPGEGFVKALKDKGITCFVAKGSVFVALGKVQAPTDANIPTGPPYIVE